ANIDHLETVIESSRAAFVNNEKSANLLIKQAKTDSEAILNNAYVAASEILNEAELDKKRISHTLKALNEMDNELSEKLNELLGTYLDMIDNIAANSNVAPSTSDTDSSEIIFVDKPSLLSASDSALLKAHIAPLVDIEGISSVWVCDNLGSILTQIEKPGTTVDDFKSILSGLALLMNRSPNNGNNKYISQAFIRLDDRALMIQPLAEHAFIAVLISDTVETGSIVSIINNKIERLLDLLPILKQTV
ncbi:MAG: hypothetical protein HY779_04335, partial [Rubrobacteridae bacterium]|nr:hypothetical protein [Rubrobacteridae bacterium]